MDLIQKDKKISAEDIDTVSKYCRGCSMFSSEKDVRSICTILTWYRPCNETKESNIKEVVGYIKNCPCKKCVVKIVCEEVGCDIWKKYVQSLYEIKTNNYLEKARK